MGRGHVKCVMSQKVIMSPHFPNMEVIATTDLYFDGIRDLHAPSQPLAAHVLPFQLIHMEVEFSRFRLLTPHANTVYRESMCAHKQVRGKISQLIKNRWVK